MRQSFFWTKIALINLAVVAAIGVLMRYKIGFEFPYFDQKYLQHAHSHFAFAGWVTHILYVFLSDFLKQQGSLSFREKNYQWLIGGNLICAYGMLFSFAMQGYGAFSITFATASIFLNYAFTFFYFRDLKQLPAAHPSKNWFKAALLFSVLSSAGTFYLAYMMVTKDIHQHAYLASVYFYLHFQYSGWFFFACMGLFFAKMIKLPSFTYNPAIFRYFFIACVPAYWLSILWMKLPIWVFAILIATVILQLAGLYQLLALIRKNLTELKKAWHKTAQLVFAFVLLALCIKLLLQAGSTIPEVSKLAFGFRPIVIAYLHLVLLAFTTLFLIGYLMLADYLKNNLLSRISILLIVAGVFLNELVLTVQGVASFGYILIPYLNETLFLVSAVLFLSLILLVLSCRRQKSGVYD